MEEIEKHSEEKLNCWQVKGCGHEPRGTKADKEGICPVPQNTQFTGVNGGIGSGRFCWTEKTTICAPDADEKFQQCLHCSFFTRVQREEGQGFVASRSAFVGGDAPWGDTPETCELCSECSFYQNYRESTEVVENGWVQTFCNHYASSTHCERKLTYLQEGRFPPDNVTPTGRILESTL